MIGLYDLLSAHFDVTIVAPRPALFDDQPLPNRNVVYIRGVGNRIQRLLNRLLFEFLSLFRRDVSLIKKVARHHSLFAEYRFIADYLATEKPDFTIAVDFRQLWYLQLLGRRGEFLSLEIVDDAFRANCDLGNINSVIIQTRERYDHLFGGRQFKTFLIQNAPIFAEVSRERDRKGLVYCGTAWNGFGLYHYLEFLKAYPEFRLTIKGAILKDDRVRIETEYDELVESRRLIVDNEYLDDPEVVDYLRQFRIGFCFYNFDVDWVNTFNYRSAPSGKLFKYFAAGVPVVGIDTSGLAPVQEFDCGLLIKDLDPASIKSAIDEIEAKFDYYSENCLKAGKHYSLDNAVEPFVNYLIETHRENLVPAPLPGLDG